MDMLRVFALALVVITLPASVRAAQLYLDPQAGTYGPGDTFILNVRLDNGQECVNTVDVKVTYPHDRLRAVDFSRGGSILTLWAQEPKIDHEKGEVTFAGGIPGGYCGRITGDPSFSNTVAKIVFTVTSGAFSDANIEIAPNSQVLLHDGLGTVAELQRQGMTVTLVPESTGIPNPWLALVKDDTIPPDEFKIEVQSTRGIFRGRYYAVFSTVDKQSGVDHYDIFERGSWKTITSPYQLSDQTLSDVRIRAVDKAGNERLGVYVQGSAPPRERSVMADWVLVVWGLVMLIIVGGIKLFIDRRMRRDASMQDPPPASP